MTDIALAAGLVAALIAVAVLAGRLRKLHAVAEDGRTERRGLERRANLLRATAEMSALEPGQVFGALADAVVQLGFPVVTVGTFDAELTVATRRATRGLEDGDLPRQLPTDAGLVGAVATTGETILLTDYSGDPRTPPALRDLGLGTTIVAPIRASGELAGVVLAAAHRTGSPSPWDVEVMQLLAHQAGRALEVARAYELQERTVARLKELDDLKTDFVSTVSHELRTPLTVIHGLSQTLQRRGGDMTEGQRALMMERVEANAARLNQMIAALLDFSRLQAGGVEVAPQTIDVATTIEGVVDRMRPLSDGHVLLTSIDGTLGASADPSLIQNVIENLVVNAIKHTPRGTQVVVRAGHDNGSVSIEVADDGPGIPADDLPRLRERFFRGGETDTRDPGGLGLGLALADQILEAHGSRLEVSSIPGHGAAFSFRLPRASIGGVTPMRRATDRQVG